MSVYKPKNSPFFHYDFRGGGVRFHGSTGAAGRRDAEAIERVEKDKARAHVDQARRAEAAFKGEAPLTLDTAVGRYWLEAGQHRVNAADLWRDLGRIVDYFGKDCLLADITDDAVARLVAWRRGHRVARRRKTSRKDAPQDPLIAPATVNRSTTQVLQRVFTRAIAVWKVNLPNRPDWRQHKLKEPRERVRELRADEDLALAAALDPDYEALRRFALASGLRQAESLLLWSEVDLAAGVIRRLGKGGEPIRLPITGAMMEILLGRRGHHPTHVFTYLAKRPPKGARRGERFPITRSGLKTHFRRRRAKAGVADFRWHDNRHDFGSKLLRATGNLRLVQNALGHRKIETTTKYTHVLEDEVRSGMEAMERRRDENSRTDSRNGRLRSGKAPRKQGA